MTSRCAHALRVEQRALRELNTRSADEPLTQVSKFAAALGLDAAAPEVKGGGAQGADDGRRGGRLMLDEFDIECETR